MKTLIVRSGPYVLFLVTNHPDFRLRKIQQACPVLVSKFGVTTFKARDIKAQFSNCRLPDSDWFKLTDEFEHFLAGVIGNG